MSQPRVISQQEYLDHTYAKGNRRTAPEVAAPATPQDYISRVMEGDALASMQVGSVPGLGLTPEEFMQDLPLWLGARPEIADIAYEMEAGAVVIGSGPAGSTATLRLAELGVDTVCLEAQTWEEYDAFACDMATYNSEFFRSRGVPEYDLMEVYNEYMRKALGHAHPKLVRDYVTRSGEMMDWVLKHIPQTYIDAYAHPTQYKGNRYFTGETCGQKSFIGMLQWRDEQTNNNMWPFVMRSLHECAQKLGARYVYGAQGIYAEQDASGAVTAVVARDVEGNFFRIRCRAAVAAAGDFGGNPDMRIDLCDTLRNLAWTTGLDRTKGQNVESGGRDGSGIRLCLWAGGTMEAGPRAGQGASLNDKPSFPFGGCWPTFGPDGRRFMNETITKFGANGAVDMLPPGGIVACVTDANWDEYCEHQGYGHEVMDRSNEHMLSVVRADMEKCAPGPDGFDVHAFARYGESYDRVFAASTVEELGRYLGYEGEALSNFVAEVDRWNALCDAHYDSDWGCDPTYLFPIRTAPFFGTRAVTGEMPPHGGLCQHAGVCTDGSYNVLTAGKQPIPGLYAVGNCCGQRFGVQYHTPTAGNSCGSAMTTGYVAAESVAASLK